jgi:hypothetical protein
MTVDQLIRAALPELVALLDQAFAAVGHAPAKGSALDQAGFLNGAEIVEDFLVHGEPGLALEHLIYMVYEPDLPISTHTYDLIVQAGELMGMDSTTWERINPTRPE